jgi:hypothetical protein
MSRVALILGSAPTPVIPSHYDDIYCANGSVASAYSYCNKGPVATVMGGSAPNVPTLVKVIKGLNCGVIYARSMREIRTAVDIAKHLKNDKKGWLIRFKLLAQKQGIQFESVVKWKKTTYFNMVIAACGSEVLPILRKKDLSSGVLALILAISTNKYEKYIMAGFRFNEEYEYQESNKRPSGHYHTDLALIKLLIQNGYPIETTEISFSKLTGLSVH